MQISVLRRICCRIRLFRAGSVNVNPVIHGRDRQRSFHHPQTVVDMNAVARRIDCDRSSGDHQIIVGFDPMFIRRRHRQTAAAVDRQVIVREYDAARAVRQCFFRVLRPGGKTVFRSFCQRQENLISLIHTDTGIIRTADLHAVQQDPDLRGIRCIHNNAAVCQRTGHHIFPGVADVHTAVVRIGAPPGNGGILPFQCDHRRSRCIPAGILIVIREPDIIGVILGVGIDDTGQAKCFAVHEENGPQHGKNDHDDADFVEVFAC